MQEGNIASAFDDIISGIVDFISMKNTYLRSCSCLKSWLLDTITSKREVRLCRDRLRCVRYRILEIFQVKEGSKQSKYTRKAVCDLSRMNFSVCFTRTSKWSLLKNYVTQAGLAV